LKNAVESTEISEAGADQAAIELSLRYHSRPLCWFVAMRSSQFFLSTLKEPPADAEIVSHRLMVRAGLIRRLAGGIYTWLPLGLRVVRKVEAIIRSEMNRSGAIELLMPAVQPAELWRESSRWQQYGAELLRLKDRHDRDFCIGPTHEEVITDIARRELRSYRQLPIHFYQIQTKFRDEIRPRFGVMRGREFTMKDGYSFHVDHADLQREYRNMYDTYTRICTRLGLKFRAVAADPGSIGGTGSHEFHVLADSGEDAIAYCPQSDYAANVELAEALPPSAPRPAATEQMRKVATPGKSRCEEVATLLGLPLERIVKSIAVMHDTQFVLLLVRGDHSLNEIKVQKVPGLDPFRFATDAEIKRYLTSEAGYIGPVGIDPAIRVIADRSVAALANFVCGANEAGYHLTGVNFSRDCPEPQLIADLRNVVPGDASPDGKGSLEIVRGIEVGHIFQLRTKYSEAMKATFLDERGETRFFEMGCYGIGVTRIVAAAMEQNNDERGIIWPSPIAPFDLSIIPLGYNRSHPVRRAADELYEELSAAGVDVFLDDRDERSGVLLADAELVGMPRRLVIGERGLKNGTIEFQRRRDTAPTAIRLNEAVAFVKSRLCETF
jgi:prolyl-tRNA synthetase